MHDDDGDGRSPTTALIFPGQGSQEPGMEEGVREHCPELLDRARTELGANPFHHLEEGTAFLQPAVYLASIAAWRALGEPAGDVAAGHSLGELTALAAAGCMSPELGLDLVVARGRLMQDAADSAPPGGLVAIIGDDRDAALALGAELGLTLATDNEPRQVVLAGPADALEESEGRARELGLRAVRLEVAAALHSPAMAAAADPFRALLETTPLSRPRVPVFSNVTAQPFDDVPLRLAEGIVSCVRWREVVLALDGLGVERYLEPGPGTVLTGLVRRVLRRRRVASAA
jgi:[acyl-carrier-protein] S-malonyltransferase